MKRYLLPVIVVSGALVFLGVGGRFAYSKPPSANTRNMVAEVNGEAITRGAFERQMALLHMNAGEKETKVRKDPAELLNRMINGRLIIQEAGNIGLDQVSEVKVAMDTFRQRARRQLLYSYHVRNIKADQKAVERLYKASIKEMRISSVLVDKEEDARQLENDLKIGGDFGILTGKLVAEGKGKGGQEGVYIKEKDLLPEVAKVMSTMKAGEVSPVVPIGKGFSLFRLEDIRSEESPAVRRQVEGGVLKKQKTVALEGYAEAVKKKYVEIDAKLLDRLDYDSPGIGFEAFLRDKRVVARVKGGKPVTVKDLTEALEKKFFHGVEKGNQSKRINLKKKEVLDELVLKRAFDLEAKRLKIDRSKNYKDMVEETREGLLFGVFIAKVIDPGIHVEDEEIRKYQEAHPKEYSSPGTVTIQSLLFKKQEDAVDAFDKLRNRSEFIWVRQNAPGQVDPEEVKDFPIYDGVNILSDAMPEEFRKAVSGVRSGDFRLYSSPEGPTYLLYVTAVTFPGPKPFESAREEIGKKLFLEKRQAALDAYIKKIRESSLIKVHASSSQLEEIASGLHN